MPGRGQGKRGCAKYTQQQFEAAMEAVKTQSIRSVAGALKIPRSTLQDWINNPDAVCGTGVKRVFSMMRKKTTFVRPCVILLNWDSPRGKIIYGKS